MDEKLIFAFVFAGCLLTVMISWLVFGRLSMARIEKAIMAEGKPRPCPCNEWQEFVDRALVELD